MEGPVTVVPAPTSGQQNARRAGGGRRQDGRLTWRKRRPFGALKLETSRGLGGLFRNRDVSELRLADDSLFAAQAGGGGTERGPFRVSCDFLACRCFPGSVARRLWCLARHGVTSAPMSFDPNSAGPDGPQLGPVFFDRRELDLILRVYGRMVAAGEWRDYAMAGHRDVAEFAVFRRSGDAPAYRVEKRPALQARQGQWAVIGEGGVTLKRGRDLAQVLRVFDSRKFKVVE